MTKTDSPRNGHAGLAGAIADLARLDSAALAAQWRALYGSAPPLRITRALLIGAVAYRLQERVLGGLTPAARRRLMNAAGEQVKETPVRRELAPGTILLREWHGVNHRVTVLEGGVEYRGQRYRSLSEVARVITGSRWSGRSSASSKGCRYEWHDRQQRRCVIYTRKSSDEGPITTFGGSLSKVCHHWMDAGEWR